MTITTSYMLLNIRFGLKQIVSTQQDIVFGLNLLLAEVLNH